MLLECAYGREGLSIEVPDENLVSVLRMNDRPIIPDPEAQTRRQLDAPIGSPSLAAIARGKKTACIVISDITRPVPNTTILPPILDVLEKSGIARDAITILNGTGMHRPNEGEELEALLGPDIPRRYRVVNHIGRDDLSHQYMGTTPNFNAPIYVDRTYLAADVRIVTGLIEPHLMAGFSGGRKGIMPGICGFETLKVLHGARAMAHPLVIEGSIEGNPFHEDILHVAHTARVDFMVNVTMNERREITGIFAGDLDEAHREGVAFMRAQCLSTVDAPVDAVITTAAGHPLDLTFYQAIKGITAARSIVRDGGVIMLAARCSEGIGSPEFTKLLMETTSIEAFLDDIEKPGHLVMDQWQLQKFCLARQNHDVWLYSDGIDRATQEKLFVSPLTRIEDGIERVRSMFGKKARIAVIPEGPYVLAGVS